MALDLSITPLKRILISLLAISIISWFAVGIIKDMNESNHEKHTKVKGYNERTDSEGQGPFPDDSYKHIHVFLQVLAIKYFFFFEHELDDTNMHSLRAK